MSVQHFLLECAYIEGLWFTARLAFDERRSDGLNLGATLMFATDKVANVFAVVGVASSINLRLNPAVLLFCQRNRFSHGSQVRSPKLCQ